MLQYRFLFAAPPECEPGQITCRQYIWNKTYCIPPHYRCDMSVDCIDGSDENECSKYITILPFLLKSSIEALLSPNKMAWPNLKCRTSWSQRQGCDQNTRNSSSYIFFIPACILTYIHPTETYSSVSFCKLRHCWPRIIQSSTLIYNFINWF